MKTKKTFKYFSIVDYEKEQTYLREMHKSGWKFVKVSGFCIYHFEECEPEDVIYQLDYNQDGIEHKDEYITMFSDCGWEYLQDYAGYSYFRKPADSDSDEIDPQGIFCDEGSRLELLERIFRGRLIPMLVLFSCSLLPSLALSVLNKLTGLSVIIAALIVLYVLIFARFARKYFEIRGRG